MKKLVFLLMVVAFSHAANANPLGGLLFWEECSFACKVIPPIEYSYVAKPISSTDSNKSNSIEQQQQQQTRDSFRVMVWNIFKSRKETWKQGFGTYAKSTDILLLQEVILNDNFTSSLGADYDWDMAVSFMMKKGDEPTGIINSSSFQKSDAKIYRTEDREPFSSTPKMMLSTKYELPDGRSLLAINIHGINFRKKVGLMRQVNQAKEEILAHNGPVIFAGDFNTKSKKRRAALDEFMTELDMKKVIWENDTRRSFLNLDHFYYKGLDIKNAEMLKDLDSSDHPMLLVDLYTN